MRASTLLRHSRSLILPLLLLLLPVALAPSALATGFTTDGPFEVDAVDRCADENSLGCIDVIDDQAIDLWSPEGSDETLTWISQTVTSPYIVNFYLTFAGQADSYAFYKVGNGAENQFSSLNNSAFTVSLNTNDTLTFGVANKSSVDTQQLSVSNFTATINNGGGGDNNDPTAVPAPLPLLGAAAAFGIIRRRRAQLRAARQFQ